MLSWNTWETPEKQATKEINETVKESLKIIIQKSVTFIYTNNEVRENEGK